MDKDKKSFVINSPYKEPNRHHKYNKEESRFYVVEGRRRAGYNVMGRDDSEFIELELVNEIRRRVKDWRGKNYPGVTRITARLLEHWHDADVRRETPFFFCQLEAVETLIFLAEIGASIDIPNDGGEFRRLCTKLCTGGGKTLVMSMLIAWQLCNAVSYPRNETFTKNILVIAPNLTVKKRLQVLRPETPGNYYALFDVVPSEMRSALNQGKIFVHNWHVLEWENEPQKSVVKLGPKSDNAYCREIIEDARNILVINDEAHHAWRVPKKVKLNDAEKEAAIWIQGLDRIHHARNILTCYDFSATPFVPGMNRNDEEGLFKWIVSDFGLDDGIEAGIVKTPRIVINDNTPPDVKTSRSKLLQLYNEDSVKNNLNTSQNVNAPLPDIVRQAYFLLGADWKRTFDEWQKNNAPAPPVMITVANRTETAERLEKEFENGSIKIPSMNEPGKILRIDSRKLDDLTTSDAEELRRKVDTVGKPGELGGEIRSVISVGMLSEGWDAKNVTHIMGLRAFTSQLLCEQVVGRGLRRTSYDPPENDDGLFTPEYVNVFGVPFGFLLYGLTDDTGEENSPVIERSKFLVRKLDDRNDFAISWPNIERLEYTISEKLSLDVENVPELELNAENTRISAELAPVLGGKADLSRCGDIDLEKLYSSVRLQEIIFSTAGRIYDELQKSGVKLRLIGQVIGLTEKYLRTGRLKISPELFVTNEHRRKILFALNMEKIMRHLWGYITSESREKILPVFVQGKHTRSTFEMQDWYTSRPNALTKKSHVNRCVYDSSWEASESYCLDRNPQVKSWVKNDHLNFYVSYLFDGVVKRYLPDFLVKLDNDVMLVLEVKGRESEQDKKKRAALSDWCEAVNGTREFGIWKCDVSRSPADVDGIIAKYAK